jgi:hypothetical protein
VAAQIGLQRDAARRANSAVLCMQETVEERP